jgi:hypothetical protein
MFPDSLPNMWAFSRQPSRGLLRTEVQNRLSFFFLVIFITFFLRKGRGGIAQNKVEAYANASRLTLYKKENQIFLIYKEFRMEQLQSHI